MTMLEIYKSRKDNLATRIMESKSLYETGSVISEVFETMQYQYLSQGGNEGLADELAQLMSLAKASFPLLESVNKTKLWEKSDSNSQPKKKSPTSGLICMLLGFVIVFATVGYCMFLHNLTFEEMKIWLLAVGIGCIIIFFSGFMLFHRKKIKTKPMVEISVDAGDIVNRLEEVVKAIDLGMEKAKLAGEKQAKLIKTAINSDEIEMFSYLMEAKFSGQADFALEQLDEVEHYLAKQDVILVNYTKGNEKYFEFLDGEETKTIRPAFVRNGEILKQGLAQIKTADSSIEQ